MISTPWFVASGVPAAAMARSAATTVGSTGSECTDISGTMHWASVRSAVPRKSKALLTPSPRTIRFATPALGDGPSRAYTREDGDADPRVLEHVDAAPRSVADADACAAVLAGLGTRGSPRRRASGR